MSRIGRQPIIVPEKVEVKLEGDIFVAKGPKGELKRSVPSLVKIEVTEEDGQKVVKVSVPNAAEKEQKAIWGTMRSLINGMVTGVTEGFVKKLEVVGVGYKAAVSGKKLTLNVGYSHPVEFEMPEGIEASVEKNIITISGIDKELVGQVAANIRKIRKPEPYKGKGIKYIDEIVRRKAGKAAKAGEGAA
ncbi:50S ribosomal protein L6 [Candidatus Saccharibacteria bacterium]|nr:50S ribosomal protein L6 [Candidatus Saccharibacteria bacterium]NIV03758.1 50S ribosomal protein L6 [Calditrichia bacterium]NIS38275.1 50S ribosomal protein L6 [Candidatus Saccharibacteria bacterium]NIV72055.1 50S ribosomal protein L6 [Calditrichia bacterium]NIV98903.1 50S ribosomal protein L6 [Candidatus Saccharibacteria bacterium]